MNHGVTISLHVWKEKNILEDRKIHFNNFDYTNIDHPNYIYKWNIFKIGTEDDNKVDINTVEKENVKDIQEYQEYQENIQDEQPWASSQSVRMTNTENLPDPLPITDTEGCPKCGNIQAYWWLVQTDAADEPSSQFFRCTKCNHTWRTPKSS